MTKTEHITRDGKPAIKVTCDCRSHAGHGDSAVITGATAAALDARKGKSRDDRIHGFVLLANHPAKMMQMAANRDGVFAK